MRTVYYVNEENPEKAEAIVKSVMAPNEMVVAWGPLPETAVKALGLDRVSSRTHDDALEMPPATRTSLTS